jgi:hypothetical protein
MTLASGTVQVFKPNCDGKFAAVIVYSEIYQVCCAAAWAGCQSSEDLNHEFCTYTVAR